MTAENASPSMRPWDPGVRVAIGISGSGKTHSVRSDVYQAAASGVPVLVIDALCEWTEVPYALGPVTRGAHTVKDAAKHVEQGARLVIVRAADAVEATVQACEWARHYPGRAGVAVPEAHRVMPNGARLPLAIDSAVCQWRHHQVLLWCDTQRLAQISRTVTEQAGELRIFAVVGDVDLAVLRTFGSRDLATAVSRCAQKFAEGSFGWHVRLGIVRSPPYRIERKNADGTIDYEPGHPQTTLAL